MPNVYEEALLVFMEKSKIRHKSDSPSLSDAVTEGLRSDKGAILGGGWDSDLGGGRWTSQVKFHVDSSSYALLSSAEHLPTTDYRPGPLAMVALH